MVRAFRRHYGSRRLRAEVDAEGHCIERARIRHVQTPTGCVRSRRARLYRAPPMRAMANA